MSETLKCNACGNTDTFTSEFNRVNETWTVNNQGQRIETIETDVIQESNEFTCDECESDNVIWVDENGIEVIADD